MSVDGSSSLIQQGKDIDMVWVDQATSLVSYAEGPILAHAQTIEDAVRPAVWFSVHSVLGLNTDPNSYPYLQCPLHFEDASVLLGFLSWIHCVCLHTSVHSSTGVCRFSYPWWRICVGAKGQPHVWSSGAIQLAY